jgi:hypothetical protein
VGIVVEKSIEAVIFFFMMLLTTSNLLSFGLAYVFE